MITIDVYKIAYKKLDEINLEDNQLREKQSTLLYVK